MILLLSDIKEIWDCSTRDDIKKTLCVKLDYDFDKLLLKEKILLDLHFHTLLFAKEQKYNEEQTSALFSIIKKTHNKAVETPFGNIDDTFAYFKELLACHSVKRPPFCIYLYHVQEVVAITEYAINTYFRHFKLYKYAFTPKIVMNVSVKYADVVEDEIPAEESGADGSMAEMEKEADDVGTSPEPLSSDIDDTPAIKELKQIIGSTLDEEIIKLKLNVDEILKTNEENILRQLGNKKDANPNPDKNKNSRNSKKRGK